MSSASSNIIVNSETPTEIYLETDKAQLVFNGADGMLRKFGTREGNFISQHNIRASFMSYGTRSGKKTPKSGAYIFLPDNEEAQALVYNTPKIRVTTGEIFSKIEILIDKPLKLKSQIKLVSGKNYFEIENDFHLGQGSFGNKELLMRFFTDIQNEDLFYTDLNGFQIIERKRYDKIPLQGNVYPMPAMSYIQDDKSRFTVLTGQPLGECLS